MATMSTPYAGVQALSGSAHQLQAWNLWSFVCWGVEIDYCIVMMLLANAKLHSSVRSRMSTGFVSVKERHSNLIICACQSQLLHRGRFDLWSLNVNRVHDRHIKDASFFQSGQSKPKWRWSAMQDAYLEAPQITISIHYLQDLVSWSSMDTRGNNVSQPEILGQSRQISWNTMQQCSYWRGGKG